MNYLLNTHIFSKSGHKASLPVVRESAVVRFDNLFIIININILLLLLIIAGVISGLIS